MSRFGFLCFKKIIQPTREIHVEHINGWNVNASLTELHLAILDNNSQQVMEHIASGEDINVCPSEGENIGLTPLHLAIIKNIQLKNASPEQKAENMKILQMLFAKKNLRLDIELKGNFKSIRMTTPLGLGLTENNGWKFDIDDKVIQLFFTFIRENLVELKPEEYAFLSAYAFRQNRPEIGLDLIRRYVSLALNKIKSNNQPNPNEMVYIIKQAVQFQSYYFILAIHDFLLPRLFINQRIMIQNKEDGQNCINNILKEIEKFEKKYQPKEKQILNLLDAIKKRCDILSKLMTNKNISPHATSKNSASTITLGFIMGAPPGLVKASENNFKKPLIRSRL